VLEALSSVNAEFGTTTAIITHNAEIRRMAHRVFTFSNGRIVGAVENAERAQPAEIAW
jgi:putative ABC transport system ATP-binding protein